MHGFFLVAEIRLRFDWYHHVYIYIYYSIEFLGFDFLLQHLRFRNHRDIWKKPLSKHTIKIISGRSKSSMVWLHLNWIQHFYESNEILNKKEILNDFSLCVCVSNVGKISKYSFFEDYTVSYWIDCEVEMVYETTHTRNQKP